MRDITLRPLYALALICLLMLGACESALLQETGLGQPTAAAEPERQTTSGDPADALDAFVAAWNSQNYETMHSYLASRSRELYPLRNFIDKYTQAQSVIKPEGIGHDLRSLEYQGATAVLSYDITIASPTFGSIKDQNRIMRLVDEAGWKIAWTPMDIIKGMSSRARLNERREFPQRANIYARDGLPLAQQDAPVYSLYAIQEDMRDVDSCLDTLALATRQELNSLKRIFADYLDETLFHVAEIDSAQYERHAEALAADCDIRQAGGALSKARSYRSRSYYGHGIATHVVGYIGAVPADELERWEARGYAVGDKVGRAGIELAYEDTLAGKPQRYLRILESGGTVIRELAGAVGKTPRPVTLTIDRDLQASMAGAIGDAVNAAAGNWGGITTGGALAALDVNSGALLAMASYPSFDPHIFNPDTEYNLLAAITRLNNDLRNPFINKALAEQYTPGSVYKVVTALAAASEGIWDGAERYECGHYWYGQRFGDSQELRTDWRLLEEPPKDPVGSVTLAQALAASCNPFFYELGALMFQARADMQTEYARLLGLGGQTGIRGLGIEAAGDLAPPVEIESAINNAIGQGSVAVTVLQMAQMTAAIANGGALWQPFVVSHSGTEGEDDFRIEQQPTLVAQLELDAAALDLVRDGMCQVTTVEDLGTAWFVFADAPFAICGKTGTAETAGNPHSWFVAYYPREQPQLAFAGVMAHSREGSEVVAPMIRRTLDDWLGEPRKPFPDWWQGEYIPVKTQQQALAELESED